MIHILPSLVPPSLSLQSIRGFLQTKEGVEHSVCAFYLLGVGWQGGGAGGYEETDQRSEVTTGLAGPSLI